MHPVYPSLADVSGSKTVPSVLSPLVVYPTIFMFHFRFQKFDAVSFDKKYASLFT